ncbi:hypothetical protein [Alcanivorax sp. NBRC 102028]|uniref:hypothetical protein n=1 Tax=Alcanivorax sp. NBRC 102028 TaxID=1113897 RepID=UPI000A4347B3|nr:hypothetical protein [Alcanivorax sp. NBRC 102028]
MKKSRFTEAQIVSILKEVDLSLKTLLGSIYWHKVGDRHQLADPLAVFPDLDQRT